MDRAFNFKHYEGHFVFRVFPWLWHYVMASKSALKTYLVLAWCCTGVTRCVYHSGTWRDFQRGLQQLSWVSNQAYVPCCIACLGHLASCKGWMEAVTTKQQATWLCTLLLHDDHTRKVVRQHLFVLTWVLCMTESSVTLHLLGPTEASIPWAHQ